MLAQFHIPHRCKEGPPSLRPWWHSWRLLAEPPTQSSSTGWMTPGPLSAFTLENYFHWPQKLLLQFLLKVNKKVCTKHRRFKISQIANKSLSGKRETVHSFNGDCGESEREGAVPGDTSLLCHHKATRRWHRSSFPKFIACRERLPLWMIGQRGEDFSSCEHHRRRKMPRGPQIAS